MASAYRDDLRKKLLEAHAVGKSTLRAAKHGPASVSYSVAWIDFFSRRPSLSAALLAGPQSNRKGLEQTQTKPQSNRRTHRRNTPPSRRTTASIHHAKRRKSMVQNPFAAL